MAGRVTGVLKALGYTFPQEHRKQILALDRQFDEMEREITTLNAENQKLRSENAPLEREIERLQEVIESDTAEKERTAKAAAKKEKEAHLGADEDRILSFIARVELGYVAAHTTIEGIAARIEKNAIKTKVLLRKLEEGGYVYNPIHSARYVLNDLGQEYVVKHNLDNKFADD